jgi:hypothetical protein
MRADERRSFFRTGLSTLYLPFYDQLCARLGPHWQPYSGVRSFSSQDALYAQGRTTAPLGLEHRVTSAKGGQSAHNYGCATDWTFFDGETLLWLPKEDPRWVEYGKIVVEVGLKSGQAWKDPGHNELNLSCDWPHILLKFQQGGMTAAQNHIRENLLVEAIEVQQTQG